jgi:aryl-alcohol dehydrogenase-like predicted oxidoreductase
MAEGIGSSLDRREFFQTGAVATASALALSGAARAADAKKPEIPKRKLGKTGVELTILNLGTWRSPGLDRLVRTAFASGVRVYDTAKSYGSEPGLARWFQQQPEVRKEIFLVTKDSAKAPREMIAKLDERLETLKVDHVDLFFIHALGDNHSTDEAINLVKSKEFKETADAIRKSGKAKFVGFSSHHRDRAQIIQAAAEGGIVDAIMLQYTPWLKPDDPLNKALDACHEKGIGLISMKQVAGQFADAKGGILDEIVARAPVLKEKELKPYQGLLHAIWSDERITTCCISMRNTDQIRDNVDAALKYDGPLQHAQIRQIRDAALAYGPTLCADCDGRCARAGGTKASLGDLTRLLTYHEHHGYRAEARRQYAELAEADRAWQGADLEAAQNACPNRLNFGALLPKVDQLLS